MRKTIYPWIFYNTANISQKRRHLFLYQ